MRSKKLRQFEQAEPTRVCGRDCCSPCCGYCSRVAALRPSDRMRYLLVYVAKVQIMNMNLAVEQHRCDSVRFL